MTLADGDPNALYVATERDGGGGSLPKILRYDTSAAGATLAATNEWDLSADLPGLGANLGLEAIAFVPDTLLVAKGLIDDAGTKYNPADYPNHGNGLFFVGVEQTGQVIGYALNRSNDSFTRISTIASTFSSVMELEYEPETTHLWAMCDNNCQGRSVTLDINAVSGKFAVTNMYARPGGMDNFNNEGFAIAPRAECVERTQADVLHRGQRRGRPHPAWRHDQLHAAASGHGPDDPTPAAAPRRRNRRLRRRRRVRHRRRIAPHRRSSSP